MHRIIPRRRLRRIGANIRVSDYLSTICSVVGKTHPAILRIDGGTAALMSGSLINRAVEAPAALSRNGGCLAMILTESGGTTALRVTAFHPPNPKTRAELIDMIESVLARYGLMPIFW